MLQAKKGGITTLFLSKEDRAILNTHGVTVRGCFNMGVKVLDGTLPKIQQLAAKLAEVLQEKAQIEQKLKSTTRELKVGRSE
jgi:hypothetical protein